MAAQALLGAASSSSGGFLSTPIFSIFSIIIAIAGVAGAAWAVLRSNLATSTIDLLKQNNEALKDRVAEVERDNAALTAKVGVQSQQIATLTDLATQATAVQALSDKIADNHKAVLAAIVDLRPRPGRPRAVGGSVND